MTQTTTDAHAHAHAHAVHCHRQPLEHAARTHARERVAIGHYIAFAFPLPRRSYRRIPIIGARPTRAGEHPTASCPLAPTQSAQKKSETSGRLTGQQQQLERRCFCRIRGRASYSSNGHGHRGGSSQVQDRAASKTGTFGTRCQLATCGLPDVTGTPGPSQPSTLPPEPQRTTVWPSAITDTTIHRTPYTAHRAAP